MTEPLYTHPTLRTAREDDLRNRLENIRSRRLVAALEHQQLATIRIEKEHTKLNDKWEASESRISKKLYKIMEDIEAVDKELTKLTQLHNQLTLLE